MDFLVSASGLVWCPEWKYYTGALSGWPEIANLGKYATEYAENQEYINLHQDR